MTETPSHIAIIHNGEAHHVPVDQNADGLSVDRAGLSEASGWAFKDVGLCRGEICIPMKGSNRFDAPFIDLAAFADAIGAPLAVDESTGAAALGAPVDQRRDEQDSMRAPEFALPDLSGTIHRLSDHRGRKVLLVAWSSWCGCREDMPVWQSLYDELKDDGLTIITVAQDSHVEDAREFIERASPTHPSLIDTDHVISERYGLINVPSVVWIDEDGLIRRPPSVEHGSNVFTFAHGLDCEPHLAALRAWVKTGEADLSDAQARASQMPPTFDEQLARAEFALGNYLYKDGNADAARIHWEKAIALSPEDWTIRRGTMRLRGENPFGEEFGEIWREWEGKGRPDYQSLAKERRQA
ncbi:MAG: redoxin domain-containing protein [Pseudomonadota bacterium]